MAEEHAVESQELANEAGSGVKEIFLEPSNSNLLFCTLHQHHQRQKEYTKSSVRCWSDEIPLTKQVFLASLRFFACFVNDIAPFELGLV